MAGSYNKVLLMGNLTRDPELRHLPNSNNSVAQIGLAVNRRFKTADGELREEVTFIDCDAFGRTAEMINQYFKKGRPIFVEGRLKLDQWEKDGQKHSKIKVVIENFQFVDSRPDGPGGGGPGGGGGDGPRGGYSGGGGGGSRPQSRPSGPNQYEPVTEEDIPF